MKKLADYTKILRSKNAGPLFITFDLIFETKKDMNTVLKGLTKEVVAKAYGTDVDSILIIPYEVVNSIKITFPRKFISGSVYDTDIYGCQQHMKLAYIKIMGDNT